MAVDTEPIIAVIDSRWTNYCCCCCCDYCYCCNAAVVIIAVVVAVVAVLGHSLEQKHVLQPCATISCKS